jgi:hypothetical protein
MQEVRRNSLLECHHEAVRVVQTGFPLSSCGLFVMLTMFEPFPYVLDLKSPLFADLDTSRTHALSQIFV